MLLAESDVSDYSAELCINWQGSRLDGEVL